MISVNFDPVNNNIFTLVESKIEVNFGGATYEGGGGGATTANVIPPVALDISAYTEIPFDTWQEYGGVENANWELDVDMSLNPDTTIYKFEAGEGGLNLQYNLNNVELNKIYYFRFGGTYMGADNPIVDPGDLFFFKINGVELIELAAPLDYSNAEGTVMCFVMIEPVTVANIQDAVKFSYYKDDFRMLAPRFSNLDTNIVKFTNYGRNVTLVFNNQEFLVDANLGLRMDYSKIRLDNTPFNTVSNKRINYVNTVDEEDWIMSAAAINDYGAVALSANDINLQQGHCSHVLTAARNLKPRNDVKVGYKGICVLTPAGFALTFDAKLIPRPASQAYNSASSKVVIIWNAISATEVLYELTNIA